MSLILDALNRAERERKKTQAIPDLQTVHEPLPPVADAPRNKNLAGLLLVVAVLALVAIIYGLTLSTSKVRQPAPEQITPMVAAPAPREPEAAKIVPPVIIPAPVEPPEQKLAAPAPIKEPERALSAQSPELDELYATARAGESPVQDSVSNLYVAPSADVIASESVASPLAVAVRDYNSLIEIPDLGDLPWGFRQEIPSLNYVRHNFDQGGVTSVVINGRAHHTGSTLAPELVLEEIYSDGVIIRFKQIRFKLRALNSWINM